MADPKTALGPPAGRLPASVLLGLIALVGVIQITEMTAIAMAQQQQAATDQAMARIARMER
jgi:hypothetical protein